MKKAPSLLKLKKGVMAEIKKRDPKAQPKLTKVGLIDLMPERAADRIYDHAEFADSISTENSGDPYNFDKMVKRMAIDWFKQQRGGK